jgi:hypothetical protein
MQDDAHLDACRDDHSVSRTALNAALPFEMSGNFGTVCTSAMTAVAAGPWLTCDQTFLAAGCIGLAFMTAEVHSTHEDNMRLLHTYEGQEELLVLMLLERLGDNSDLTHLSALIRDWRDAISSLS